MRVLLTLLSALLLKSCAPVIGSQVLSEITEPWNLAGDSKDISEFKKVEILTEGEGNTYFVFNKITYIFGTDETEEKARENVLIIARKLNADAIADYKYWITEDKSMNKRRRVEAKLLFRVTSKFSH
ncbi:MAG: hypothetical protein CV087_22550 [Candidatus Brocadia sp. WS118]|nr:MAG: hypothetical protein CV087_22550 [Candidatus Brocadia sp. WS118]